MHYHTYIHGYLKIALKTLAESLISQKFSWGACPQTPLERGAPGTTHALPFATFAGPMSNTFRRPCRYTINALNTFRYPIEQPPSKQSYTRFNSYPTCTVNNTPLGLVRLQVSLVIINFSKSSATLGPKRSLMTSRRNFHVVG